MTLKGCDLSHHQLDKVNFSVLKREVDFVILRAGYTGYSNGFMKEDNCFQEFAEMCDLYNIPFGAYWFSQATTVEEAEAEAEFFYELIADYNLRFPVYIDTEYSNPKKNGRADNLTKSQRTNIVAAFCRKMESFGYYCGFYCSVSWLHEKLNENELVAWDWWAAKWSLVPPTNCRDFGMWQYTNGAQLNGVSARVDMNCAYKDYPAIITTAGLNKGKTRKFELLFSGIREDDADKLMSYAQELGIEQENMEIEVI